MATVANAKWWSPSDYTEEQRDMHFIVVNHGWMFERRMNPNTMDYEVRYVRHGLQPCETVETAYAVNKALVALER